MGLLLGAIGGAGEGLATYAKGEQAKDSQLEIDRQRSQLEEEKEKRIAQFRQNLEISGIGKRSEAQLAADQAAQPARLQMASTASTSANNDVINNRLATIGNERLTAAEEAYAKTQAVSAAKAKVASNEIAATPEALKASSAITAADAEAKQSTADKNLKNAQAEHQRAQSRKLNAAIKDLEAAGKMPEALKVQLKSLEKQIEEDSKAISKAMAEGNWQEFTKDKDGREVQNPLRAEYAKKMQRIDDLLSKGDGKSTLPEIAAPTEQKPEKPKNTVSAPKDPLANEKMWITKRNGITNEKELRKFIGENPSLSAKMKQAAEELLQDKIDSVNNFQAGFETPL